MKNGRRKFTGEEKMAILRRHLGRCRTEHTYDHTGTPFTPLPQTLLAGQPRRVARVRLGYIKGIGSPERGKQGAIRLIPERMVDGCYLFFFSGLL